MIYLQLCLRLLHHYYWERILLLLITILSGEGSSHVAVSDPICRCCVRKWQFFVFWGLIIIYACICPIIIWHSVIATSTSGMVKDKILSEVWELQRAQTIRRIARFIDALRIEVRLLLPLASRFHWCGMVTRSKRKLWFEPSQYYYSTTCFR